MTHAESSLHKVPMVCRMTLRAKRGYFHFQWLCIYFVFWEGSVIGTSNA